MAAEVRIQTFVQLIKFCGGRQFSASKSPTSCSCKTLPASLPTDTVKSTYKKNQENLCYLKF